MQNYYKQMQKKIYHCIGPLKDWPANTDYFVNYIMFLKLYLFYAFFHNGTI